MSDSFYHDKLLSEYHAPKNYGLKGGFDLEVKGENPFCGDSISVRLKFQDDIITDVSFESESCVISRAAASYCSEYIKGKSRDEVWAVTDKDIESFLGIELSPSRKKCGTLFLDTIRKAI